MCLLIWSGEYLKKSLLQTIRYFSLLDTNIAVKFCQRIFPLVVSPPLSAVVEWDSDALFKGRKGSGKDNSFIPVFITKHKFYIKSISKGSLTLFPFPMLN